ncbi:MAG: NAD-dependent epimerase/dehydratase family protein [Betaproteobacteria bacterium]|nr:MAG: NAD-dependent epimerase/dehydratase family protein [Betaproteobacteria bacterium]
MIFQDKAILVTGGTGSMGSTLVRRVLSNELGTPKKVIVFSRDEAKQHDMRMSYLHRREATDEVIFRNFMNVLEFRIGDVRSYPEMCAAVRDADIVVNAENSAPRNPVMRPFCARNQSIRLVLRFRPSPIIEVRSVIAPSPLTSPSSFVRPYRSVGSVRSSSR